MYMLHGARWIANCSNDTKNLVAFQHVLTQKQDKVFCLREHTNYFWTFSQLWPN